MEDLQVRFLRNISAYPTDLPFDRNSTPPKLIAISSRYGIAFVLAPENRIYTAKTADIQQYLFGSELMQTVPWRIIDYFDATSTISFLDISTDGTILAVSLNNTNGAFVQLFDVQSFDPTLTQQPFPLVSIPVSTSSSVKPTAFEWNPCNNPHIFAASAQDNTLLTIQYELEAGSSFKLLGNKQMKSCVTCISWSPKGKQLTVGDANGVISQLMPDLTSVRVTDSPKNVPGIDLNSHLCCIGLCWLSTTEWLVAYSNQNRQCINVGVATIKKQQPPNWKFFGDIMSNNGTSSLVKCPALIRFNFIHEWQIVIVSSNQSATTKIIGNSKNTWSVFENCTMPLYFEQQQNPNNINCFGVGVDYSLIVPANGVQYAQPIVYFANLTGNISSYIVITTDRQMITPDRQAINPDAIKFGPTPAGFKARDSGPTLFGGKTNPSFGISSIQQNPVSQSLPSNATKENASLPVIQENTTLKESSTITPLKDKTNDALNQQIEEKKVQEEMERVKLEEEQRAKEKAEEDAKKELENLGMELEQSIASYCAKRNSNTKKMDLAREISAQVEQLSCNFFNESEEFLELINDIHFSLDDAGFNLKNFEQILLHNFELVNKLKILYSESQNNSNEKSELDFNQQKRIEVLQKSYEKALENYARMKILLEKTIARSEKNMPEKRIISNDVIDPVEQKKINETTEKISKMVMKISARIVSLQQQMKELKNIRRNGNYEQQKILQDIEFQEGNSKNQDGNLMANQCALMVDKVMSISVVDTPDERIKGLALGDPNNDLNEIQANFSRLMMNRCGQQPHVQRVKIAKILEIENRKIPKKEEVKDKDSLLAEKIVKTLSAKRPTKVSVATQSPVVSTRGLKAASFLPPQQQQQQPKQTPQRITAKVGQPKQNSQQPTTSLPTPTTKIVEVANEETTQQANSLLPPQQKTTTTKVLESKETPQELPVLISPEITNSTVSQSKEDAQQGTSLFSPPPPPTTTTNVKIAESKEQGAPTPITKVDEAKENAPHEKTTPATFSFNPKMADSNVVVVAKENVPREPTTSPPSTNVVVEPKETTSQQTPTFSFNPKASTILEKPKETTPQQQQQTSLFSPNSATTTVEAKETPTNSLFTPKSPTSLENKVNTSIFAQTPAISSASVPESTPIKFSFKPPTSSITTPQQNQAPMPSIAQGAAELPMNTGNVQSNGDVGMEDEMAGLDSVPICQPSSAAIPFSFNKTGLGSTVPTNVTKNPFGGAINSAPKQDNQNSWLFSGSSTTTNAAPTSSLFGGGQTQPIDGSTTQKSAFGNTGIFGSSSAFGGSISQASTNAFGGGSTFGGGPSAFSGKGSTTFGGAASFGGTSAFGGGAGSAFGAAPTLGTTSAFGGAASNFGGATNPVPVATGFSAFANKASGFGQLAQNTPTSPNTSSLFGGGGTSAFGGSPLNSSFQTSPTNKPSSFTTFRK